MVRLETPAQEEGTPSSVGQMLCLSIQMLKLGPRPSRRLRVVQWSKPQNRRRVLHEDECKFRDNQMQNGRSTSPPHLLPFLPLSTCQACVEVLVVHKRPSHRERKDPRQARAFAQCRLFCRPMEDCTEAKPGKPGRYLNIANRLTSPIMHYLGRHEEECTVW